MDVDKAQISIQLKCLDSGSFEEKNEYPTCLLESGKNTIKYQSLNGKAN